jgi:hypothetical protein
LKDLKIKVEKCAKLTIENYELQSEWDIGINHDALILRFKKFEVFVTASLKIL